MINRLLLGVYLSPNGDLAVLEIDRARSPRINFDWIAYANTDAYIPYSLIYAEETRKEGVAFIPLDKDDAKFILSSWEYLGPLKPVIALPKLNQLFLKKGAIWIELDKRYQRHVEIIAVSEHTVFIRCIESGKITCAYKTRFNSKAGGYKPLIGTSKRALNKKLKNTKTPNRRK